MKLAIHSHALGLWCPSILCGERLYEEACVGKPQAGFCEGEAHNGAWSNSVTLSRPKGESNGEHKADLHTGGVLSTRPHGPYTLIPSALTRSSATAASRARTHRAMPAAPGASPAS